MSRWREVITVAAGDWHSVGLRHDGTVVATGNNRRGQCEVEQWRRVRGISAGYLHTIAVTRNGRVLVAGDDRISLDDAAQWQDILTADVGSRHILGSISVAEFWQPGTTAEVSATWRPGAT